MKNLQREQYVLLIPPLVSVYADFKQGTPRYIARAVASGQLITKLRMAKVYHRMPELEAKAKELYLKNYGQDTYDAYIDVAANIYHGSKFQEPSNAPPSFSHRPDHDVESLFWVLVFCVILALPLDADEELTQDFVDAWTVMETHAIVSDKTVDPRTYFLTIEKAGWEQMVHPKLSSLAGMMIKLADQIAPEYGYLNPPPKRDHLHEAFRRILLEQILAMEDNPIPLTPNVFRHPPPSPDGQDPVPRLKPTASNATGKESTSRKRKAEDSAKTERKSKSVKSTSVHSARYIND